MAIAFITLAIERTRLRLAAPVLWIAALVIWSFIGLAVTAYPAIVTDKVTELAKVCAIMLAVVNTITTRTRVRFVLLFMVLLCVLFPVRGTFFNYYLYGNRLLGRAVWIASFSNPNDLGAYCLLQLSIALAAVATEKRTWLRRCSIGLCGCLVLIVFLTASRAALIGLACFAVLLLARRISWQKLSSAVLVAAVVAFLVPNGVWQRVGLMKEPSKEEEYDPNRVHGDEGSVEQRMAIWKVALSISKQNPIFGVGVGAYSEAHLAQRFEDVGPLAYGRRDAHSTYLTLLAETGFIGLLLYFCIIASVFRKVRQAKRMAGPEDAAFLRILQTGVIAFLVAGVWGSYGAMAFFYVHLAFVYAVAHSIAEQRGSHRPISRRGYALTRPPSPGRIAQSGA
jgi:O-antigen ligase